MQGTDRRDMATAVFEQHREEVRHLDRQQLYLAISFIVIAIGTILAGGFNDVDTSCQMIIAFLLIFSLFCFLVSIWQQASRRAHEAAAAFVLIRYGLDHYLPGYRQLPGGLMVPVSRLYPALYLFGFSYFMHTMMTFSLGSRWLTGLVPVGVFLVGLIALWLSRFDHFEVPRDDR